MPIIFVETLIYKRGVTTNGIEYCLFGENMPLRIYEYTDQMWEHYLKPYNLSVSDFDL
jgi:hypothetical protein